MSQLQRTIINSSEAPQPLGAYSQGVRVKSGELLFVAGQVALDAAGNLVGEGDVATQTRQVFHNLSEVLSRSGANLRNVVEFTTYLVGRDSIQPFLNARALDNRQRVEAILEQLNGDNRRKYSLKFLAGCKMY